MVKLGTKEVTVIITIMVVLLLAFAYYNQVMVFTPIDEPQVEGSYYHLDTNETYEGFRSGHDIQVTGADVEQHRNYDGLELKFKSDSGFARFDRSTTVDTVSMSLDVADYRRDVDHSLWLEAAFKVDFDTYYKIVINSAFYHVNITYICDDQGLVTYAYGDLLYDGSDDLDLLLHVEDGRMVSGVNGIDDEQLVGNSSHWDPRLEYVKLGPGREFPKEGKVLVKSMRLGHDTTYHYQDILHKTIVPYGKDFAYALHLHADRAYLEHFYALANLTREYGLLGTYDAWVYGDQNFFSMDDENYTMALLDLQDEGWDIGVHALSPYTLTRDQVIEGLEYFRSIFGPPRTWSDHSDRQQDLRENGTNASSPYFVRDLVEEIGAAWWHLNEHSHSIYNDLNRQGLSYVLPGHETLPLFRVSQMQAKDSIYVSGMQADVGSFLRAWPAERSVIVQHEYLADLFYVTNETGSYSVLGPMDDIGSTPWSQLVPKRYFIGDEWHPLPRLLDFLNWTENYDIWFSTVRDIYDRSCLVQEVTIVENQTAVVISNGAAQDIDGFTLFTKAEPNYALKFGETLLQAEQGQGGSWHFIIDLEGEGSIILEKIPFN